MALLSARGKNAGARKGTQARTKAPWRPSGPAAAGPVFLRERSNSMRVGTDLQDLSSPRSSIGLSTNTKANKAGETTAASSWPAKCSIHL
eukprot:1348635-Pyramimonas_sp.AAC.1